MENNMNVTLEEGVYKENGNYMCLWSIFDGSTGGNYMQWKLFCFLIL